MIAFYLITGFLGAGKTTFLKHLVQQLSAKRLHILINEYGKEGVDGPLLKSIGATLDEINNGSIFCSCRLDRFETALETALNGKPDCILVEASGLSDPTNIRAILRQARFAQQIDYRGCICLVDALRFEKIYHTARCCKKQLAACDFVLINKTDLADEATICAVEAAIFAQRPDLPVRRTVNGVLREEWLQALRPIGEGGETAPSIPDISLQKLLLSVSEHCTYTQLLYILSQIAEDSYRIKGFVQLGSQLYLADCVGTLLSLTPYSGDAGNCIGCLNILSGQGMPIRSTVKRVAALYPRAISLCLR